jgi:hypothetical protein
MTTTQTNSRDTRLPGASWEEPSNQRTLSELRLIIAMAAALGVALESRLPAMQEGIAYLLVLMYVLASLLTLWVAHRRPGMVRASVSYWLDAGWLITLLAVVGTESNLFVLLLFPIMLASFQSGFIQGMAMTLACVIAYSALSVWSPVTGDVLSGVFGSIIALAVLGYMSSAGAKHCPLQAASHPAARNQRSGRSWVKRACCSTFRQASPICRGLPGRCRCAGRATKATAPCTRSEQATARSTGCPTES